jgi:hypothetical protein
LSETSSIYFIEEVVKLVEKLKFVSARRASKLLVTVALFAMVLSVTAAEVSAYWWHPRAYIKVVVYGPKSYATSFKPREIVTIRIYDRQGRTEIIRHRISYYESVRNKFAVKSIKSFYIDKPVTVKVTFRGSTKTAILSAGRPKWNTRVISIQL